MEADRDHRRKKVVIVEDDAEVLDLEAFLLATEGYDVVSVQNGAEATEAIRAFNPDVVLLDLMLPGKDGNTILSELAADQATRGIKVIVVSAYTPRLRPSPLVRRVLSKPFDVPELLEAVAEESRDGGG
jgi:CheY-like chemotaxis protein